MLATWHFHIEISSKCTLGCPRCARQEVSGSLVNTELDLEFFKRNFTPEFILSDVEKITFCGDDGDPIYAHDLIPVIQYIKSIKQVKFVIITNGSYKKTAWWRELAQCLNKDDEIHFSLDGYDNTSNNVYRVNSDWDSIINGVKAVRENSKCKMIWAAIGFKSNEDHLSVMSDMATALGFDVFQLTKSTKFGSIYPSYGRADPMEPNRLLVSSSHRFERAHTILTSISIEPINNKNLLLYDTIDKTKSIIPLCEIGNKGIYIDARGRLFPCCWVANRYSHNTEWQKLAEQFDLHRRKLSDVVSDEFWEGEFQSFKWQECQSKCNRNVFNKEYATAW